MSVHVSVVLPAYNEVDGLRAVVQGVLDVLRPTERTFEVILVDDGSSDGTWDLIRAMCAESSEIRGLRFSRNFGHQLAVHAGLKASSGDYVAIMDSDGQDPPTLLPEIITLLESGHDVVNCVRKKRKEPAAVRLCYYFFYRIYGRMVAFDIPLDSGDFSGMNRRTADILARINQHTPFIRGIRSWAGGSQVELPYERLARQAGTPKYRWRSLFILALTGITAFSKVPLRISIVAGLLISTASLLFSIAVVALKLLTGYPEGYGGWASLATLIAFLGGAQLTVLGIIGEYLGHVFDSVRGMPPFQVAEVEGFGDSPPVRILD